MRVIKSVTEMRNLSLSLHRAGRRIGFVPTMGALHEGHLSLLKVARDEADEVVMSVFVNPAQFGPNEDLERYPRDLEADCASAEKEGCDFVFAPSAEQMYPSPEGTFVTVEGLTRVLEGEARPTHFRGVTTIVTKLLNVVSPDVTVFGQKDAQQVIVVRKMITDLNMHYRILVAPTVREPDGLALSSRNRYLSKQERKEAPIIYEGLSRAADLFGRGEKNADRLREVVSEEFKRFSVIRPEYVALADPERLQSVHTEVVSGLLAVACRTEETGTRLIDNIVLGGTL